MPPQNQPVGRPRKLATYKRQEFEPFADKTNLVGIPLAFVAIRPFKTRRFGESLAIRVSRVDSNNAPTGEMLEIAATMESALGQQVRETFEESGPFLAKLAYVRGDSGYSYYMLDSMDDSESEQVIDSDTPKGNK